MADNLSKADRKKNMSHIRSSNTKPEKLVGCWLHSKGLRYRKNVKTLPGKPDFVFPKYKTVVFVNGCFWHMHDCGRFKWPSSNIDYWRPKIERNVERDRQNIEKLTSDGWLVITVWECELKPPKREQTLQSLFDSITANLSLPAKS